MPTAASVSMKLLKIWGKEALEKFVLVNTKQLEN
jgi:hypothetical protein